VALEPRLAGFASGHSVMIPKGRFLPTPMPLFVIDSSQADVCNGGADMTELELKLLLLINSQIRLRRRACSPPKRSSDWCETDP